MDNPAESLFPLFLKLSGRRVLLVGGGPVATAKARALAEAGARVSVVAPLLTDELDAMVRARAQVHGWSVARRPFQVGDVDGAWLVVAAAPPTVNAEVAAAAEARQIFVVAVDDLASASAYGAAVVRRGGITAAISTDGHAPALAGLLREGLEALLPPEPDAGAWLSEARRLRPLWRADQVPMAERRPRLLQALNGLYESTTSSAPRMAGVASHPQLRPALAKAASGGRVTLVGAGPGEPDLLTIRGARCLAEADLILYDALSSDAMRTYAPNARWFYVGKRACRQSIGQEILNRLMIKEARRGHRLVRLKCGDPFVFGRGGEEMLSLAEAGIPCEVVPGVSSAVAGPALAGIPVTHRGAASSFMVIAGHHRAVYAPLLAAVPLQGTTIVVLMGLAERAAIATTLLDCRWAPETPAAIVIGAATPAAWRWTGTLAQLGACALPPRTSGEAHPPGLLVIGSVVAVATQIESMGLEAANRSSPGGRS